MLYCQYFFLNYFVNCPRSLYWEKEGGINKMLESMNDTILSSHESTVMLLCWQSKPTFLQGYSKNGRSPNKKVQLWNWTSDQLGTDVADRLLLLCTKLGDIWMFKLWFLKISGITPHPTPILQKQVTFNITRCKFSLVYLEREWLIQPAFF